MTGQMMSHSATYLALNFFWQVTYKIDAVLI